MSLSVIHKKCGSGVYQLLNDHLLILCTFGIGNKSTKLSLGNIETRRNGLCNAKYYCISCKETVEISELLGTCSYCGKPFPVEDLFRQINDSGKSTGDTVCELCIEKYALKAAVKTSLATTLKKVFI